MPANIDGPCAVKLEMLLACVLVGLWAFVIARSLFISRVSTLAANEIGVAAGVLAGGLAVIFPVLAAIVVTTVFLVLRPRLDGRQPPFL